MYTMTIGNRLNANRRTFFDPRTDEYTLLNPAMDREDGKLATLSFTIFPGHPEYGNFSVRNCVINVYLDGVFLIPFRPIKSRHTFKGGIEYTCEELAGVMNDVFQRPIAIPVSMGSGVYRRMSTITSQAKMLHDSEWDIQYGNISNSLMYLGGDENWTNGDYTPTWDLLMKSTVSEFETGHIVPRYELPNKIIIDYLDDDDLPEAEQSIEFGENLADLFIETGSDEFFNRLVPLGKDVKTTSEERRAGLPTKLPLTIMNASDNPGSIDYIDDEASIAQYGVITKTQRWEDIGNANELYHKGVDYLAEHQQHLTKGVTLTAIDLRDTGADIAAFRWMTKILVHSDLHGVNERFPLTKQHVPLGAPDGTKIQIGDTSQTLTDMSENATIRANRRYEGLDTRVFNIENP